MIKTLRITSVVAVVLAVVFFVFPAVFGFRSDKEVEEFLNLPGAIEKFKEARGGKTRSESQISPLVKQAEAFALYLSPPKPKRTIAPPRPTTSRIPSPPAPVSAKFRLIGTSYYASHPEMSLALIDEPGKGFHWVKQGSEVGHLVIEQIKDGVLVVQDGQRTFELEAERTPKISLLKVSSSGETASEAIAALGSREVESLTGAGAGLASRRPPQISAEESAVVEGIFAEMETMQKRLESGEIQPEHIAEKSGAMMEKLFSDLEAMSRGRADATEGVWDPRISAEEAEKLGDLGKELEDENARPDPNRARGRGDKIEASSREPNSPEKK